MGAAKKLEMPSDEKFLSDAIREGRAVKMQLSMKALGKLDISLQQRVHKTDADGRTIHLDVMHVARLERMLRDGTDVYPIVVFRDPATKKDRVADGFHRHEAHRKAGVASIWAWVIEGTYRDAMIYSTMCNQLALLQRKPEDIKKAVFALLSMEDWQKKTVSMISSHVGCSPPTTVRYRAEYFVAHNIPLPEKLEGSDGRTYNSKATSGGTRTIYKVAGNGAHRVSINGKRVHLGMSSDAAEDSLRRLAKERDQRTKSLLWTTLRPMFARAGLSFSPGGVNQNWRLGDTFCGHGIVGIVFRFARTEHGRPSEDLPKAHGRIKLVQRAVDPSARAVVVCNHEDVPRDLLAVASADGVEYLTPDELIASLNGDTTPNGDPQ